jgi:hypothetical protein
MNWIEIDKTINGLLATGSNVEKVMSDTQKMFKWNESQAEAAVRPLAKNFTKKKKKRVDKKR